MAGDSPMSGKCCAGDEYCLSRRRMLVTGAGLFAFAVTGSGRAAATPRVSLSVPGPGSAVGVPVELALRLGFDREVGLALQLRFVDGGGVAIKELREKTSNFAVFGLPAAMSANLAGAGLIALLAIDDLPLYTLVLRSDLTGRIRRVADLRGLNVGVFSNSLAAKTTSQQVAELLLSTHGIATRDVNFIAAGQTWESQAAMMRSRIVHASLCDEPFATRLVTEKLGTVMFSLGNPQDAAVLPGGRFLRAALISRRDQVEGEPDIAGRVVRVIGRALQWMSAHKPAEVADALDLSGVERQSFLTVAMKYPRQYSRTGYFSRRQLVETNTFFRGLAPSDARVQQYDVESMIQSRWSALTE